MLGNNWIALIVTLVIALGWLRINDFAAHKGWISGPLSRKIIHIGTGPIFVLCWLFFKNDLSARFLAAIIPLGITIQFALVGLGFIKDQSSVDAMSRTGDRKEILRGPLFYGIVFVVMTLVFWYDNPIGIVALMLLCGGDGLADIVGKRIASAKLPWSKDKSWVGSVGMFVGGWLLTVFVIWVFIAAGIFRGAITDYLMGISIISFVAVLVESLPFKDIDNITVPLAAVILGFILLPL